MGRRMLSNYLIYGLLDPRNREVRYVGKSCSGLRRPNRHRRPCELRTPTYKNRWVLALAGLGLKPEVQILEDVGSPDGLCERERWWIAKFREDGARLTNLTDGGEGSLGYKRSEAFKKKMSALLRGNKRALGFKQTPESKEKIRLSRVGKKASIETRMKLSLSHSGKRDSQETIEKKRAVQAVCSAKRLSVFLTVGVETRSLSEWLKRIGLSRKLVEARLRRGWGSERALSPVLSSWSRQKRVVASRQLDCGYDEDDASEQTERACA